MGGEGSAPRSMRVVVAGGSGFVGRALVSSLVARGATVRCLSRQPERARRKLPQGVEVVGWDNLPAALGGVHGVVNLAGYSLANLPWTAGRKRRLVESRLQSTRALVTALRAAEPPPAVFLNASAVGYYGDRGEEELTDLGDSRPGGGFLADLCRAWEQEAQAAVAAGARVALLRFGLVLGRSGGALPRLLLPFRLFTGIRPGSGRQWVSWVHLDDAVGLILFALERDAVHGPLNVTAPTPARMESLIQALAKVTGRPARLVLPDWILRRILGDAADLFLGSQRALPARARTAGYTFRWPELEPALTALLRPGEGASTS